MSVQNSKLVVKCSAMELHLTSGDFVINNFRANMLHSSICSKGSFMCNFPQTGKYILQFLIYKPWGWDGKTPNQRMSRWRRPNVFPESFYFLTSLATFKYYFVVAGTFRL